PFDWWDLDQDDRRDPNEPWSYDNYRDPNDYSEGIDKSHGWEGNSQDTEQRSPDSEDRDGDLSLDTENSYFSYRVPLNPNHPDYDQYVFRNSGTNWLFIRIPLKDSNRQVVGSASLTQVGGVRIWFSGFSRRLGFSIAEFNIVGNEWRKTIVAESDTSGYDITVLNNFDNSDFYVSPPGVSGNEDYSSGLVSREQSLVMDLQDLPYGETAWIRKQLVTAINLAEYRELKMFVHGGELDSAAFALEYQGKLEYKLRLQSSEGSYYEYSKFIKAGWDPANSMRLLFDEITGIEAFTDASRDQEEPGKPVILADGGQVTAVGNPAITLVRSMLIGVKNHGPAPARTQVWFNELRVSDVKKPISRAMRAEMNADFSDVMTLKGSFEQKDADYHTVKERAASSGATFKRNASGTMTAKLGRLLPPSLGVAANLGLSANRNFEIPKYFPNDDREVIIGEHPAWIEKDSRGRSVNLTLSKTGSKSWVARNTVDKLSFSTTVSQNVSRNETVLADTSFQQDFSLGYNNGIRWTHRLKPLAFTEDWFLLDKVSGLEIGYMPESIQASAATRRNIRHRYDRDLAQTHTQTYELTRKFSISIKLLNNFTISGGRDYNNNLMFNRDQVTLRDAVSQNDSLLFPQVVAYNSRLSEWKQEDGTLFDGDYRIQQRLDFSWNPDLTKLLTTRFSYNTTYGWSRDLPNPAYGVNLTNAGRFSVDVELKTDKVIQGLLLMNEEELNTAKRDLKARKDE
ncbi:cell surface protein SprA, partial [bacterium]|nr:cell surface protein SprA [bacterium]